MRVPANLTNDEIRRAFLLIQAIAQGLTITGQTVRTAETPIAHGLGRVPVGWIEVSPQDGLDPVKQSRVPDAVNLYLLSATELTPTLLVF